MNMVLWNSLSPDQQSQEIERANGAKKESISQSVSEILAAVKLQGNAALLNYTLAFDRIDNKHNDDLLARIDAASIIKAEAALDEKLYDAMCSAIARIDNFHQAGLPSQYSLETAPGVVCERIVRAIDTVGIYIPGGSAPLFSSVMMLAIPARIAGCSRVVLCTPRQSDGSISSEVLAAASLCGITEIYGVGGAQAIAAMAYGTETIPKCDKIFGPGNAWVTEAKRQVASDPRGAAIDMPAGPSEVMVIADQFANATVVASDLLAQAEHGADSQVILLTDSTILAQAVINAVKTQSQNALRLKWIESALQFARFIVVDNILDAIKIANRYAPEHLLLNTRNPRQYLASIKAAGSIFIGPWAAETLGDYCSGTNHVLPTDGAARAYSGVSVSSFCRFITVQTVSEAGLRHLGFDAIVMAQAEGLQAHANAISTRLDLIREQVA